ncbi:MAG TPA: enoyl-CoA hydratase-related protein [Myxococcales bacterium]|nr:enoyl-CoA hydratase-related protein [Myxococcales bacterium]
MATSTSNESTVRAKREGAVLTLTLDHPSRLNALDWPLLESFLPQLRAAARDRTVRVVVVTGAGKAFCAGGDLKACMEKSAANPGAAFYELASVFHLCVEEIRWMEKPVVAAINGVAAGGGFSLALACDLRLMAKSASLKQAYTSAGLAYDGGSTFTLPRLVGMGKALEMAMLDEPVGAEEALRLGLVTRVVPDGELAGAAAALAEKLAGKAVGAIGRVKRLLNGSFDHGLEAQLELERQAISDASDTPEGREGVRAFVEKRPAKFQG